MENKIYLMSLFYIYFGYVFWLHRELFDKLRDKNDKYKKWKQLLVTTTEYQQIVQICKDTIREAKAQSELK